MHEVLEIAAYIVVLLLLGLSVWPLSSWLFRDYEDGGWLFSKILGLVLSAYLLWVCNCTRLLRFTRGNALLCVALPAAALYAFFILGRKWKPVLPNRLARREELFFILLFLLACYITGFNPWVKDTEKFMDYGFLTAMGRSDWMPFQDPWFSGEPVNYYYGGQYLMAFLMRLCGTTPGYAYNLMRAFLTTASFLLPFSIGCQLLHDKGGTKKLCLLCGTLTGLGLAFSANGQYLLYGIVRRGVHAFFKEADDYFYPDPSRFISTADGEENLAHEFPAYSSILGDVHAHYINLILVLLLLALLYAWSRQRLHGRFRWLDPYILLLSFLNGLFRWTNFWDMPIYFVVCGAVILFTNVSASYPDLKRGIGETAFQGLCFLCIGTVAALPFTLSFHMISSRILLTHSHSSLYRLAVVWLIPFLCLFAFCCILCLEYRMKAQGGKEKKQGKGKKEKQAQAATEAAGGKAYHMAHPDMVVLLFGLCAAGLVLLPEFVYVEDIYEGASYRFNTMFKLTYQAFVLFSILMGYVFARVFLPGEGKPWQERARRYGKRGILLLLLMSEYIVYATRSRFGHVTQLSERYGLDASQTFPHYYPEEAPVIDWLNENITGQPVLLEAPGLSYTDYERISVATGLPTVVGWHTHEHLWRDDLAMVQAREADVDQIYRGTDAREVRSLLQKYGVSYIYIGKLERERYPELNEELLKSLGETVYQDAAGLVIRLSFH